MTIQIDQIYIYDPWDTGTYTLKYSPEYFRFFDYYGDYFINADSQYNDYSGTTETYPQTWSGGGEARYIYYYDSLTATYIVPLDWNDASEEDNNEICIEFKIKKGLLTKSVTLYFGDNEIFDTWFWTSNIYIGDWGGGIRVHMRFDI